MDLYNNLHHMQVQINKLVQGHCLLIKLINYDELCSMFGHAQDMVHELYKIVRNVCGHYHQFIFLQSSYNKILVVLPHLNHPELHQIIYNIYAKGQLYVNPNLASAYINCHISSINFPEDSNQAKEIYTLLVTRISNCKKNYYYHEYDKNLHNIHSIKSTNEQLNLLRKAVINHKLKFDYQPIIESANGQVSYLECLLRFPDENGHFISIGTLVEEAENKGLINVIDHIALEMAVKDLYNDYTLNLSVNISNTGIVDKNLLSHAKNLLTRYSVAERLIIELTETGINEDYQSTKKFMDDLHKYGCKFALDDFGSGFTSFKQLQNLPIDIVKIDGSYIRNIHDNPHNKYFVKSLIKMLKDLNIKTVAEFVENDKIARFLIDLEIYGMQGNYFSPACSKEQL